MSIPTQPMKAVLEFTDDTSTWTLDVLGQVGVLNDVEHVYLTIEQRRPDRKRPIVIRVDLDCVNAASVAMAIADVVAAVQQRAAAL